MTSAASSSGSTRASRRHTTSTTGTSPLRSSGTPMAAASTTAGCATASASTSAGPTRLPATLSVSSERPWRYQNPSRSRTAQSPWTQVPGTRRQYVVQVALAVRRRPAPEPARHPGPRLPDRELAHLVDHRRPVGRQHVRRHAEARAVERRRPDRPEAARAQDPAADLRPARVVDDRDPAAARDPEQPPPGSGFQGSPVDPSTRSDDRSAASTGSSPWTSSARIRVGLMPRCVTRWRSTSRQTRPASGKSGAPSNMTSRAPSSSAPLIAHGPIIQPRSVIQHSASPWRRSNVCARSCAALTGNPPCTWTVPLGAPVVPDV